MFKQKAWPIQTGIYAQIKKKQACIRSTTETKQQPRHIWKGGEGAKVREQLEKPPAFGATPLERQMP